MPLSKKPCTFFLQSKCSRGDACVFSHEAVAQTVAAIPSTSSRACTFFQQGRCNQGALCRFQHPNADTFVKLPVSESRLPTPQKTDVASTTIASREDTRGQVPCRFLGKHGGCKNVACPFLHEPQELVARSSRAERPGNTQSGDDYGEDDNEDDDDFTREIAGATVLFGEKGQVSKVSLSTDYSMASITGFQANTTPENLAQLLESMGLHVAIECIQMSAQSGVQSPRATIKVDDPSFATTLVSSLQNTATPLVATIVSSDSRARQFRKVYLSWYRSTRLVWLNFGSHDVAQRVSHKFNQRSYTVMQRCVKASAPKCKGTSLNWSVRKNPLVWTVVVSDVPGHAQKEDVARSIRAKSDQPRHIELGKPSYISSEADVAIHTRERLEEHGALESFFLSPTNIGKRCKATALFENERGARAACTVNNEPLSILGNGKLTVSLVETAKVKLLTSIFIALKSTIDCEAKQWKEQYLSFHVYQSAHTPFTTLKLEGENVKAMKAARKVLNKLVEGSVLSRDGVAIWSWTLAGRGPVMQAFKVLENELSVIIKRDKTRRQLRYFGPSAHLEAVTERCAAVLEKLSHHTFDIGLTSEQFSWCLKGGYQKLRSALEKGTTIFDVVARKIAINGTRAQYQIVVDMITNMSSDNDSTRTEVVQQDDCPICFCEVESPVRLSCEHTYCLDCFEGSCAAAASTSKGEFQVKCQGQESTCGTIISIHEIKSQISSSAFEDMLQASFEEYLKRHPASFRYCPTPDCGTIYRSTTSTDPQRFNCPKCLELFCTTCHVAHGEYTCAEYKDIAAGGVEALARLKKELNIKDCPRCSTAMEKTDGCNHMTCAGCKAHICWVCMAVFDASGPCYEHMRRVHGGIGLDAYA